VQAESLSDIQKNISGKAICPYSPLHNTTALMTHKGELYTATIIDKLARDPSINRNLGTAPNLRTDQMNSKWLNGEILFVEVLFLKFIISFYYAHKV
jgi:chondroitin sulfate proteoglycan 4